MSENKLIPTGEEIKAIEIMAKNATDSKYFDKLGGHSGIFSICMYARELGIPVMSALFGGMQSIMGKITISPQLMNAMIRRAGHKLEIDSTDERCIITGTRKDTGEISKASFSVEEAKKAGLFKPGGGWDKYPSDMCFARAISRLARRLFPDVIGSSYVEGEIQEEEASRKNRPTEIQDIKTEIIDESVDERFFKTFNHLGEEKLNELLSSKPNGDEIKRKALSDPERFEKWFLNTFLKKPTEEKPVEK